MNRFVKKLLLLSLCALPSAIQYLTGMVRIKGLTGWSKPLIHLLLALCFAGIAGAQTVKPGGITTTGVNTELWMRADSLPNLLATPHGTTITTWNDVSGNNRHHTGISYLNKTGWVEDIIVKNYMMNYQPSLYFVDGAQLTRATFYDNTKAYYIFYVSEQIKTNGTFNTVYSINRNNNNLTGWHDNEPAFWTGGTGSSSTSKYSPVPYKGGVVAAIRSNSSTPSIYYNGSSNTSGGNTLSANPSSNPNSEIGNYNSSSGGYSLKGDIQELIILSGTKGTALATTDIRKINSYLAIKYGQTLSGDYVNSAGYTVWSSTLNNGYTAASIFGIARDDASSLYQKQSISYTDKTFTAFVGDAVADLNLQNPATLDDGFYLMFGSNNATTVSAYSQAAGTVFQNHTLQNESFFKRLNRAYKVQLTGASSFTVKLSLSGFAGLGITPDYAMVTGGADFSNPASTRLYPVDNTGIVSIEVHSGDIIGFGYTYTKSLGDALTGGSSLDIWLKADEVYRHKSMTHGKDVARWENHSGVLTDFTWDGVNAVPVFTTNNGMNYHPALTFESSLKKLVSTGTTLASKKYMTFFVSTANTTALAKKCGTLFSHKASNYYDEGWYGNSNGDYLYMRGSASAYTMLSPGLNSRSGIVAFQRGNLSSANQYIMTYHNARPTSTTTYPLIAALPANSQTQTIGANGTDNPFYGTIQEMIMLSADMSGSFGADAMKIYSYLAIKYGINLESTQPDLYNSLGTKVWDASLFPAYNDSIFGIARDDGTSLYQKQSTNVEDKIMTVFLGSTLHNLNNDNPSIIANNTYLLFGSGAKAYTAYAQPAGTGYDNGTSTEAVSHILRKFKTQMTTATSLTVSIASHAVAPYAAKYVLVSTSDAFTPGSSTRIYPVSSSNNIASDVLINAGDYVALAGGPFPEPEAPGGVKTNIRMWLNAENASTLNINSNTGEVTEWRDQLDGATYGTRDVKFTSTYYGANNLAYAQPPLYRKFEPRTNYHPAVFFENNATGTGATSAEYKRFLTTTEGPMNTASPDLYHYFVVMYNNFGTSINRTYFLSYGQNAFDGDFIHTSKPTFGLDGESSKGVIGRFREEGGGTGAVDGNTELYKLNATAIGYYGIQKSPSRKIRFEYDGYGEDITAGLSNLGNGTNLSTAPGILGGGTYINRDIRGVISEIIAYEGPLSDDDKDRIYSYLGLKYGVTLDKNKASASNNFDYKLSDNTTVVWPGTADPLHRTYHHNVAAIVRDDVTGLNNMQSHSTDEGSVVTMGIGTRLGTNPALTGLKNDKEAIIWGNNGATGEISSFKLCGLEARRTNRIWMVNNLTQQKYAVRIGAGEPQSGIFPYGGPNYMVHLLLSKSTSFLEGDAIAIKGFYNTETGLHEFGLEFEPNETYYFCFAGQNTEGVGCPGCEFAGQKSLRFTPSNWTRGAKSRSWSLGDNFSVNIDVSSELGIPGFAAGYPRASSGNSLRLRRKNSGSNVESDMTAHMTFTSASLPSFRIYSIGRASGVNDEIIVYGKCNGAEVQAELSYIAGKAGSSYSIGEVGDKSSANAYRSSTYTSNRGSVQVRFNIPVTEVYVVYSRGARSGEIGIGPISFRCPPPAPTINTDGLGFSKDAPPEVELCENVQYVFHLVNTNCDPVKVGFTDILPAGMKWIAESLILDESNIDSETVINSYGGTNTLAIDSILVPPGSHTFMATAKFDDDAPAGTYSNRAKIGYSRIVAGAKTPVDMYSCDAYKGCGYYTDVLATGEPADNYKSIVINKYESSVETYTEGSVIEVELEFNNPNPAFTGSYILNFIYNEEFEYVPGSIDPTNITVGAPQFEVEDGETVPGYLYFNVSNIPEGTSTVTLKFEAPGETELAKDGDGETESFVAGFDMETESEDVCENVVFDEFYGEIEVPYLGCPEIPEHSITWDASVYELCKGDNLAATVSAEVECVFGNSISYRLEFKPEEAYPSWKPKITADTVIDCSENGTVSKTFNLPGITVADTGMYRVLISAKGRLDEEDCRAVSDTVHVRLKPACAVNDTVKNGTVCELKTIDVLFNDKIVCTAPAVKIITPARNGLASVKSDNTIEYTGSQSGLDSLQYAITCDNNLSSSDSAWVYITLGGESTVAYTDNVWYFGRKNGGKSPGIRFVKNGSEYEPQDASGESMVDVDDNVLVVSAPYCEGQVLFYTSDTKLYNSLHQEIGTFAGSQGVADGLAACYMSDNKYLFFSITDSHLSGTQALKAYTVDMNADHGRGARTTFDTTIESSGSRMSEGIELVPRAGTDNQYWLVYHYCSGTCGLGWSDQVHVRLVDVSNPEHPKIGAVVSTAPKLYNGNPTGSHTVKVSRQYNRIAIQDIDYVRVFLYDFDNSTGKITHLYNIDKGSSRMLLSLEFSPDGNQLYFTHHGTGTNTPTPYLYQYDISGPAPEANPGNPVQFWTNKSGIYTGGGLKVGPDGKMYVTLCNDNQTGVISDPNSTSSLADRYNKPSAFNLSMTTDYSFNFSTGLTKPGIIVCNTNTPPTTEPDNATLCLTSTSRTVKVNVQKNDALDAEGDDIYLTNARFTGDGDGALATLTVNPADSTVTLTVKSDATVPPEGHVFNIIYDVKDNGTPASACNTGTLTVKVYNTALASDIKIEGETELCSSTSSTNLTASVTAVTDPVYKWYTSQTGETPVYTGAVYPVTGLTSTTTYYVGVTGTGDCETPSGSRKEVTVSLNVACANDDDITDKKVCEPFIIDVLDNDTYDLCTAPVVKIVTPARNGFASVKSDNTIEYNGSQPGLDSLQYVITCDNNLSSSKPAWVRITIDGESTPAFTDNVWYFGQKNGDGKSPGIRFVKNGTEYVPQDASGESMVSVNNNTLTISAPYCEGQVAWYSSDGKLYNGQHQEIGTFAGNHDVADGMAACYMGDNKYLFFSITNKHTSGNQALKAYTVDMNADYGKGARTAFDTTIEQAGRRISEGLELVPRAGTSNQYWLIYHYCSSGSCLNSTMTNEVGVRLVDVSNTEHPKIGAVVSTAPKLAPGTNGFTDSHVVKASKQYNRIAVQDIDYIRVYIYDFDNSTGEITYRFTIDEGSSNKNRLLFYMEFSPDGNQIYASQYGNEGQNSYNARLYQYDISGATPLPVQDSPLQYWTQTKDNYKGGGLKLGPDGKMYVTLCFDDKTGVISDPNSTSSLLSRYNNTDAFGLDITATYSFQFSTGLTKPGVIACNTNTSPATEADEATLCLTSTSRTVKVNVQENDAPDAEDDDIYLTNARFTGAGDGDLATLTVNPADSTVTLTVKSDATIPPEGRIFNIIYDVKDDGTPASACASGELKITVYNTALASDITISGETTVCSGTKAVLTASASGVPGTAVFKWYKSQTEAAPFYTGASYTSSSLTADTTFYISVSGDSYCENAADDRKEVKVTVAAKFSGGKIDTVQTILSGQTPAGLKSTADASGGSGTIAYQWEQSTDGTQWDEITDATLTTYQPGALTVPTQYRRKATNDCGEAYSDTVTIVPVDPVALKYIACPTASVKIGFNNTETSGVIFFWYDAKTGGNKIEATALDTIRIEKNSDPLQTVWAEPRYGGVSLPRYTVELELGDCGITDPENCALTGTVLFKEDFGGNSESDDPYKPGNGIPQMSYSYDIAPTDVYYNYNKAPYLDEKQYMIAKIGEPHSGDKNSLIWDTVYDHTHPSTGSRGYFLEANAALDQGQFYEHTIGGLCEGTTLYFSAWINNVLISNGYKDHVNQIFVLEDEDGKVIAEYYTGDIPNGNVGWKQYGFRFTVPANITSLRLRIINNGTGSSGNDFGLDDIEVRFCAPLVRLIQPEKTDTAVCFASSFTFEGEYTDDNTFGKDLVYQWEKNIVDINDPTKWIPIPDTDAAGSSGNGTVHSVYPINSVDDADEYEGYYRLVVANAENIENYSCRAMSDIVHLSISPACAVDDEESGALCSSEPIKIEVLKNDIIHVCSSHGVQIVNPPKKGTALLNGNIIEYTSSQSGRDSLQYVITCDGKPVSNPAWVRIEMIGQSIVAFTDDVWYFGLQDSDGKSAGIRFVSNGTGYVPEDASGESMVNSNENSLVVSSPYCNGQTIFYASHDKLYNSQHKLLKNGTFAGNTSVADGLAACYMKDNKYLFFSVTDSYEGGIHRGLRAYVVDMDKDNGRGELMHITNEIIEIDSTAESIGLIAQAGTSDKYWLIYGHCGTGNCSGDYSGFSSELRVRLVDVSDPGSPSIGTVLGTDYFKFPKSSSTSYTLAVSPQSNRIAIANTSTRNVNVFDFDNLTGTLSKRCDISLDLDIPTLYAVEFSPDGNQIYFSVYGDENTIGLARLYQYDISETTPVPVGTPVQYWSQDEHTKGGGLKLGPDGKIYVVLYNSDKVGAIRDPNDAGTSLDSRYESEALTLSSLTYYRGMQFSTGLTKSAVIACNTNNPPVTKDDEATLCLSSTSRTVKVNVLEYDYDIDVDDTVYLTNARFAGDDDGDFATLTVNPADSTVSLTVKDGVTFSADRVFEIIYDVKDNGSPASTCNTGSLKVTVRNTASASSIGIEGETEICNGTSTVLTAKATGVTNPVYKWYESKTATSPFHTDASYTTSALLQNTTFYVSVSGDNYCENEPNDRLEVTVTVKHLCAHDDHFSITCEEDEVIPVLNNDTIHCALTLGLSIVEQPKHGEAKVVGTGTDAKIIYTYKYTGNEHIVHDTLTYKISCDNLSSSTAKVHFTVSHLTAFVDDVWYFGENSQGIRFVNNNGVYSATDASGESKVQSRENSLVVSSPYCDGQNIFYTSHNQIYNSHHEPMSRGHFMGHQSVADGLAACYIGDNKYLFFSVTGAYEELPGTHIGLRAYVVNMSADHGRGDKSDSAWVENLSLNMTESIELIAGNTPNKYWLVYAFKNGSDYELHVREIDVSKPFDGGMIGAVLTLWTKEKTSSTQHPYTLKASPQHNRLAIANGDSKTVDVFDFNNTTGEISKRRTTPAQHLINGLAYGVEFSPDGSQLYAAGYTRYGGNSPRLYQFTIGSTLTHVGDIQYWTYSDPEDNARGGGLKLGPDSTIYVLQSYNRNVGVVSNPDATTTPSLSARYKHDGFVLGTEVKTYNHQFSTGLTRPALMMCNMNKPPLPVEDEGKLCISSVSRSVSVNVLENDSDDPDENGNIYLTDAHFQDISDTLIARLTVNAADSTVTLTLKDGAEIQAGGHIFNIFYDIKDNGLPASQCNTGTLKISTYSPPTYPDIRVRICPDAGDVNLSKYLDTVNGIDESSIIWTSLMPGTTIISPAGEIKSSDLKSARVYTFTYTLSDLCGTSPLRKLYLEKLMPDRMRPLRDTVVMCYKYAEAVQINQLFGIEAAGNLTYPNEFDAHIAKSGSTTYGGAVVMNGKAIYADGDILPVKYHGNDVKMVTFTYKADDNGCLHGKDFIVTVVLTDDIVNN